MAVTKNNLNEELVFADILRRLDQLKSTSTRKWGKMNVVEMLYHLNQSFKAANGELEFDREPLEFILSNGFLKKFVIRTLPWPKNMMTAKSYLGIANGDFEKAKNKLIESMNKFQSLSSYGKHPVFGEMDAELWGQLQYKHCDHHLRQFGV